MRHGWSEVALRSRSLVEVTSCAPESAQGRHVRCATNGARHSNRERGTCENRLSVRESLAKKRVLDAMSSALAWPEAINHTWRRLAEKLGTVTRFGRRGEGARRAS